LFLLDVTGVNTPPVVADGAIVSGYNWCR